MDLGRSRIYIGIENNSNSCYLNSILQIIFTVEQLNTYIMNKEFEVNKKNVIFIAYKNLLENIYENTTFIDNEHILESEQFKKMIGVSSGYELDSGQHDAHEILIRVLNVFHEGLKESKYDNMDKNKKGEDTLKRVGNKKWVEENKLEQYSIINKIFKGQLRSKITCCNCYTENNIFDSFSCIPLTIEDTIQESLNTFGKIELINYFCDVCKKNTNAEKENIFCILPKFLFLNVCRFEYKDGKFNKNMKKIEWSNEIEIDDQKFKLKGLILHHGNSIDYGHYSSIVTYNDDLLHINDENISVVIDKDIGDPYIFLYESI